MNGFCMLNSKEVRIEISKYARNETYIYNYSDECISLSVWDWVDDKDLKKANNYNWLGLCDKISIYDVKTNRLLCEYHSIHDIDIYVLFKDFGLQIVITETDLYKV